MKISEVNQKIKWLASDKYQIGYNPQDSKECVQCLVHDKLTTMYGNCCRHFCKSCCQMAFRNPLISPEHGEEIHPKIGHSQMYALLIGAKDKEKIFMNDVNEVYRAITDRKIIGIRSNQVYRLIDKCDPSKLCWETSKENLRIVFDKLREEFKSKENVTLLFYISCHASADAFKLNQRDLILKSEMKEFLKKLNCRVQLIVCDCCKAGSFILFESSEPEPQIDQNVIDEDIEIEQAEHAIDLQHGSGNDANGDTKVKVVVEGCNKYATKRKKTERFQMSSSGSNEKSRFLTNEQLSIFTKYFVAGLRSGPNCPQHGAFDGQPHCHFCDGYRKENFIDVQSLQGYINYHMKQDKYSRDQIPQVTSSFSEHFYLAYTNENILRYHIQFVHFDERVIELLLVRPPADFPNMANLKMHLWKQLEHRYPLLKKEFLAIFVNNEVKGKPYEKEMPMNDMDAMRSNYKDLYCRLRSNADNIFENQPVVFYCKLNNEELTEAKIIIMALSPALVQENQQPQCQDFQLKINKGLSLECFNAVKSDVSKNIKSILQQLEKVVQVTQQKKNILICIYTHFTTFEVEIE